MKKIYLPVKEGTPVSQAYGEVGQTSFYYQHSGIDFATGYYAPVYSCDIGEVVQAGYSTGYGNLVVIRHTWGVSYYGHNSDMLVEVGQLVTAGHEIAKSGYSGWVQPAGIDGSHVHFETRDLQGRVFDPTSYITNNLSEVIGMLSPQEVDEVYVRCKQRHLHINEITGGKDDSERNMYDHYKEKPLIEIYIDLLLDSEGYSYIEKGRESLGIPKEL